MKFTALYHAARLLFGLFYKVEYKGEHHIPSEGAYIICPNHYSNLDPIAVAAVFKQKTYFMAKAEAFRFKPLGRVLHLLGAFPVERSSGGRKAIETSLRILKAGNPLCIFPEGTRVKNEGSTAKTGAVRLAVKMNCPIIPVRIQGSYKPFSKMTVTVGKPYFPVKESDAKTQAEELKDMIYKLN